MPNLKAYMLLFNLFQDIIIFEYVKCVETVYCSFSGEKRHRIETCEKGKHKKKLEHFKDLNS